MKVKNPILGVILTIGAVLWSCAPTRYVRPLEKGQLALSGTFGGHLVTNFGPPIPLPFTTLGAGYGVGEKSTVFASFHPTAAAFGVIQGDFGMSHSFLKPNGWRPGVTLTPALNAAISVLDGKGGVWPQLDANAYWEYGSRGNYAYGGAGLWAEWKGTRAHGEPQEHHLFPVVQAGNVFSREKWDYQVEAKWSAPNMNTQKVTVDYLSPFGQGSLGVYVGFTRKF